MDLKRLFNKGKKVVDERGGVDSLKEDAGELTDIAKGKGSLSDKAKEAAAAIKDPGAPGGQDKPAAAGKPNGSGEHQPGQGQSPQP
jgi:hypothetical protein